MTQQLYIGLPLLVRYQRSQNFPSPTSRYALWSCHAYQIWGVIIDKGLLKYDITLFLSF